MMPGNMPCELSDWKSPGQRVPATAALMQLELAVGSVSRAVELAAELPSPRNPSESEPLEQIRESTTSLSR